MFVFYVLFDNRNTYYPNKGQCFWLPTEPGYELKLKLSESIWLIP